MINNEPMSPQKNLKKKINFGETNIETLEALEPISVITASNETTISKNNNENEEDIRDNINSKDDKSENKQPNSNQTDALKMVENNTEESNSGNNKKQEEALQENDKRIMLDTEEYNPDEKEIFDLVLNKVWTSKKSNIFFILFNLLK